MNHDVTQGRFFVFFSVWVVLGVGGFLFYHLNRNAPLKRKVTPFWLLLVALLFLGFVHWTSDGVFDSFLPIMIPAVVVIMVVNYRTIRFCDSCGRTLWSQPMFSRTTFCPHCGAELGKMSDKKAAEPGATDNPDGAQRF